MPVWGMERRKDVTKERIAQNLSKVRGKLGALQEKQKELEGQLRMAEDAEKMKFLEKNKISMDRLILLNKVSEEEILALLRKKEQQMQAQEDQGQQEKQILKEAESHEKNEVTL